jgi:hypothetical protein
VQAGAILGWDHGLSTDRVSCADSVRKAFLAHASPTCCNDCAGDPTIADGILDRLVHNAHRIEMRGESMRKKRNSQPDEKKE